MRLFGNTILITGGTSGLGLEFARQLLELKNTVIITGRDQSRLNAARVKLPEVHTVQSDVSDPKAITLLFDEVTRRFPALNILVNNAGIMRKINLHDTDKGLQDVTAEIATNLSGPVQMIHQFLSYLKARDAAGIVNVSSGLAFVPLPLSPIYCASKAGLHSYTQSLRVQLKNTNVKVFELAAPGAKTPLNDIFGAHEVDSRMLMDPSKLVKVAIQGIQRDKFEIRPGFSKVIRLLSRVAPQLALHAFSRPVQAMVAQPTRPITQS